ncbi:MAG: hypothetical protein L0Z50_27905 [Verrucomicrobiales bacterium]|nr:hypothetical protein [Verrucomicrobiales bacterium]
MSAPLDFLKIFAGHLRAAAIPFAITSGMACVHYGLQQNTKDSDWIIPAQDLERLREMLVKLEGGLPPWRISYRQIFGAPLEAEFMRHGWTSHLSIWDSAASGEHKVDIFSKPPRVKPDDLVVDPDGWASQHVVAQMKKTDRDRDWPIVDGLGQRLWAAEIATGLLHITTATRLLAAWRAADESVRRNMAARRPLLARLAGARSEGQVERMLLLERLVWERVNDLRHGRYLRAWKDFYRRWWKEGEWEWPTSEPFWMQHKRLLKAVQQHRLPPDPLSDVTRDELVRAAVRRLGEMGFPENEVAQVLPPMDELLP